MYILAENPKKPAKNNLYYLKSREKYRKHTNLVEISELL